MSAKMVQIGARVPHADAEFLATLQIEGAKTPSDKLRAILAEARRRHEGLHDYQASLAAMHDLLAPTLSEVRRLELARHTHSELVVRVLEWMPEFLAFVMSRRGALSGDVDGEALQVLEEGTAERVFRLLQAMLQLAVTARAPCYRPAILRDRMGPVLDLVRVIDRAYSLEEKE